MCVTTTDMREGCCAVRDDKSCNNNCIGDDSGVRKSESTDISCYNIRNCDGNNNDVIKDVISHKPRRKKYILRLVCVKKQCDFGNVGYRLSNISKMKINHCTFFVTNNFPVPT